MLIIDDDERTREHNTADRLTIMSPSMSSTQLFYALTATTMVLMWALLSAGVGADLHRRGLRQASVTRPSWAPTALVRSLRHPPVYLVLCHGIAPIFAVCAYCGGERAPRWLRLGAALVASLCVRRALTARMHKDSLERGAIDARALRSARTHAGPILGRHPPSASSRARALACAFARRATISPSRA